jgi:hypothetical protein
MRLSKVLIAMLFVLPAIAACPIENGFGFEGLYEAPESGYRIRIVSRGYVEGGYDIADNAFARVRICPNVRGRGRPLRFSLSAAPRVPRVLESEDVQINSAGWNEKLLRSVLLTAGYVEPIAEELSGSYRVISNSLSGPKGVILEGQIKSVRVLKAKPEYGHEVMKHRPLKDWITVSDLGSCDTVN